MGGENFGLDKGKTKAPDPFLDGLMNAPPTVERVTPGVIAEPNVVNDRRWEVAQNRGGAGANALELRYGDADFQAKLGASRAETLKISGLPAKTGISTWMDEKGFFIWFVDGQQQHQRMYMPSTFKNIEVNGVKQNVDELKVATAEATMAAAKGQPQGFYSYSGRTNPIEYGKRLAGIAGGALDLQEKFLRDGIASSPNNPYFHIYLSDVMLAKALKPVIEQVQTGQPIQTNNPKTMAALDEAIKEARIAQQISMKGGDLRVVDTRNAPALNPFALNPYMYNPGVYWQGGLYQSYQREVSLTLLKQLIGTGILNNLELPPALPPR